MATYEAGSVFVNVVPSFRNFNRLIDEESRRAGRRAGRGFRDSFDDEVGRGGPPPIPDDTTGARRSGAKSGGAFADEFKRRVNAATQDIPPFRLVFDRRLSDGEKQLEAIRRELTALSDKRVGIDISADQAITELQRLEAQLAEIQKASVDPEVRLNSAKARAELAAFIAQLKQADEEEVNVPVNIDDRGSLGIFRGRLLSVLTLASAIAPALVPIGALGAGALMAVAAAGAAGAAGLGSVLLATSGVSDAVKALADQSDSAAATGQKAAARQAASASAIASAERSLESARNSAASSTTRSSRAVEDARRNVARAEENASRTIDKALAKVADAERTLADAQAGALRAQAAINDARKQAARDAEDLAARAAGSALSERQAVLDLAAARAEAANVGTGDTAEAQEQAAIRLAEAELRLSDIRRDNSRLAQEQTDAAAKGVEGSDLVVAAQERAAAASLSATDAQRGLGEALTAVAETQRQGAESVAQAQQAVADAITSQAEQAQQSASSIAQAQQGVQDALRSTGAEADTAGAKVDAAFAELSPSGQAFATFLFGLRDTFSELQGKAAEAFLPGLQAGIQAMLPALPAITAMIVSLAGTMGTLATKAGEALAGPAFTDFFDYMATSGGAILLGLGSAFGTITEAVLKLIVAFGPFTDVFIAMLVKGAEAFAAFIQQLIDSGAIDRFIGYLIDNAPMLGALMVALGNAFITIIEAMLPFAPLILQIVTGILEFIAGLPPEVLSAIVLAIVSIVGAFQILGPILAFLGPIIGMIAAGVPVLGAVLAALGGPVTLIIAAIGLLVAAFIYAYSNSETFRNGVNAVFSAIGDAAMWLWENGIKPAFDGIGNAISFVWENIIKPVFRAYVSYITDFLIPIFLFLWHNVIQPAWDGIRLAIDIAWKLIQVIFGLIEIYIRAVLIPIFLFLWHNVIEPVFKGIGEVISFTWEHAIKPIFNALGDFVRDHVAPKFQEGIDRITKIWEGLREALKLPVRFVVETIINKGIIGGFNRLADAVPGVSKISDVKLPDGFARGGILPGWTPGRDVHQFYSPTAGMLNLSGGEAILRPELTAALGSSWVHGANKAARSGGVGAARRFVGGFADGGILGRLGDAADFAREGVASAVAASGRWIAGGIRKALESFVAPVLGQLPALGDGMFPDLLRGLARNTIGKLLDFGTDRDGAATPEGGWTRGKGDYPPPRAGVVSPNTAAMVAFVRESLGFSGSIGTLGNRPNKSDHPLGKAADFMIANWSSPDGIALGNRVSSSLMSNADDFGLKYLIWRGQINRGAGWKPYTHPNGPTNNPTLQHFDHIHASLYDSGGYLPPGLTTVYNGTGKPEPVLTSNDYAMLRNAADRPSAAASAGDEFHFHGDIDKRAQARSYMREAMVERDIYKARTSVVTV